MLQKSIFLLVLFLTLVSCQFTETMIINENGSGRMSISMDLSEMMAFSGEMMSDSTMTKMDTIIPFKHILEEKKDSIAQLSSKEQKKLKSLENYNIHLLTDPETSQMVIDIYTDFKNVSEANDLMKAFDESEGFISGMQDGGSSNTSGDNNVGVMYSYKKGKFKRDSYIIDLEKHQIQIDSIKDVESFMSGMTYKLKYTFPRKIKKSSVEDATYSLDGKTIEMQRSFIEYIKNPDVMDLEVELEK